MNVDLVGVLRDVSLTTLAFAIALGWSLFQAAFGLATFVEGVIVNTRGFAGNTGFLYSGGGYGLTWIWGHHLFAFGQLVLGLIELGTALLVAMLVRRYTRTHS